MFNIVLYEPEIPPNTGNIMRLCRNTGAALHLIEPLGFSLSEKLLRRAALDYADYKSVRQHKNFDAFLDESGSGRKIALTTKTDQRYDQFDFCTGDYLVFGPETRGLPEDLLFSERFDARLTLPMRDNSRSLNLSNAVAITLFEAWRQHDFC
ncbi:MAG: tRNA (cytidine(34)-2'-O)-methyltransferase [Pseudomonadales bacterium]